MRIYELFLLEDNGDLHWSLGYFSSQQKAQYAFESRIATSTIEWDKRIFFDGDHELSADLSALTDDGRELQVWISPVEVDVLEEEDILDELCPKLESVVGS